MLNADAGGLQMIGRTNTGQHQQARRTDGAGGDEYLTISRQLAEQDPSNADWQRELAMAHCRVGEVLQVQGQMDAADAMIAEYHAISRRLAEQDLSGAG